MSAEDNSAVSPAVAVRTIIAARVLPRSRMKLLIAALIGGPSLEIKASMAMKVAEATKNMTVNRVVSIILGG